MSSWVKNFKLPSKKDSRSWYVLPWLLVLTLKCFFYCSALWGPWRKTSWDHRWGKPESHRGISRHSRSGWNSFILDWPDWLVRGGQLHVDQRPWGNLPELAPGWAQQCFRRRTLCPHLDKDASPAAMERWGEWESRDFCALPICLMIIFELTISLPWKPILM